MRAKRSKKYRKLMHQYEMAFGFREPYQVLGTTPPQKRMAALKWSSILTFGHVQLTRIFFALSIHSRWN
jgi:hypothetical protein